MPTLAHHASVAGSTLSSTLSGWRGTSVLHAATQDLPCLAEVKLLPRRLYDTELAARLLGMPRVALGTLLEEAFGLTLRKEHSAADWSRRPLPDEWLTYAALELADYVLVVDQKDELGDLHGWVTLSNDTGTTYKNAELKLVAGDVNRDGFADVIVGDVGVSGNRAYVYLGGAAGVGKATIYRRWASKARACTTARCMNGPRWAARSSAWASERCRLRPPFRRSQRGASAPPSSSACISR